MPAILRRISSRRSRAQGPTRRETFGAVRFVSTIAICLLMLITFPSLSPSRSPHPGTTPLGVSEGLGVGALGPASTSLAAGDGPAHGQPIACIDAAGPMARCTATSPTESSISTPLYWRNLTNATAVAPGPRVGYGMAYDPGDGYVVLVDGGNNTVANGTNFNLASTWTYARGSWDELNITSPPARGLMSMTYDGRDGYLLLFGGSPGWWSTAANYNDSWAFSRGHWKNLSLAHAPSPRRSAAMAYDARDGYVVLFGGLSMATGLYTDLGDTWKFVGGNWTDLTSNLTVAPALRDGAQMTFDPSARCVLLFGGYQWPYYINRFAGAAYNDTWCFAAGHWIPLHASTSPPKLFWTSMTYDPVQNQVLLFGGDSTAAPGTSNQTWVYGLGNWSAVAPTSPGPVERVFETVVWDALDGSDLMYGGLNGSQLGSLGAEARDDLWVFAANLSASLDLTPATLYRGGSVLLEGRAFSFGSNITNYTFVGLPTNCSVVAVAIDSCTPATDGTFEISLRVTDSADESVAPSAVLEVGERPSIVGFQLGPPSLSLGRTTSARVVTNPGTLPLSYVFSGLPPGCASQNSSNWSCTPLSVGAFRVNVTATDVLGNSSNASATLTVNLDPSGLGFAIAPSTIDLGQTAGLNVTLVGGTTPLRYSYHGLPPGCSDLDLSRLDCTPNATGIFVVGVEVLDGSNLSLNRTATLAVDPDPKLEGLGLSTPAIDLGQPVSVLLNVTGGAGMAAVSYSGLPPGCVAVNVTTFVCTPSATGTYAIRATFSDQLGEAVNGTVTLTVNAPPTVASFTGTTAAVDLGQNVSFQATVTGGTLPISYAYAGIPADWCRTSGDLLECDPQATGPFAVGLTATDAAGGTAKASTRLTINAYPSITEFTAEPATITLGQSTNLTILVLGGTGERSFAYLHLPEGCVSANLSTLSCTPTLAGTFNVSVTVSDGVGGQRTTNATLVVLQPPGAVSPAAPPASPWTYPLVGIVLIGGAIGAAVWWRGRPRPPASDEEATSPDGAVDGDSEVAGSSSVPA